MQHLLSTIAGQISEHEKQYIQNSGFSQHCIDSSRNTLDGFKILHVWNKGNPMFLLKKCEIKKAQFCNKNIVNNQLAIG